ncbi:MAG: GWxTD domain-containing protein [Bacteroidia bacterium]|jgi:GWxTD domain-containing protein|nr:GWxTD domain-containing protein [Bacteroidia bacterium]
MKLRALLYAFYVSFLLLVCTCRSGMPQASRLNMAAYYDAQAEVLRADFALHNESPTVTRIYFRLDAAQLLYERALNANTYNAQLLLSYVLHPINSPRVIADSGRVVLGDEGTPGESKLLSGSIAMRIKQPGMYSVEVVLRDLNKLTSRIELFTLDQQSTDAAQRFMLCSPGQQVPIFRNYTDTAEALQIRLPENTKRILVKHYALVQNPAAPPFLINTTQEAPKPDTSWWVETNGVLDFRATRHGRYSFHTVDNAQGGLLLNCMRNGYPAVRQVQQLLEPLRYLMPREEYNKLAAEKQLKPAIDKFWLERAGSEERARTVIKNFYQRVEHCNTLFTTDREGWQTDRGMIYLIFGKPQSVYRYPLYEIWYYGSDSGSSNSLSFTFMSYSDGYRSDFILERNLGYKINWLAAVDAWRQGQVYTAR